MSTGSDTRLPPEVVFVPPPDGPAVPRRRLWFLVGWMALVSAFLITLGTTTGWMPLRVWWLLVGGMWLGFVLAFGLISWGIARSLADWRREFAARHPPELITPTATVLRSAWPAHDRVPPVDKVRAAARKIADTPPESADRRQCVICFGQPEVPEIGELHFEPEIITPTGSMGRQFIWLGLAGVVLVLWLADFLHLVPGWFPPLRSLLSGLMYVIVAGAVTLGIWVWKAVLRPTYVRMAPGVIQFLVYRRGSRPTIRSYPMNADTLVYVTRIRKRLFLTLARGESSDRLALSQLHDSERLVERVWQALLSTAPTPPLSEEALVG